MARPDIKPLPSVEELRRLFAYDPETGVIRWKIRPHPQARRIYPGHIAGTIRQRCFYLSIGIGRDYFYAHRIAWKMQTAVDPDDQIDHIDGNRLNNRWSNLRAATNGQNRWNIQRQRNNTSGVTGVAPECGAWKAYISAGSGQKKLGRFKRIDDAARARRLAEQVLHESRTRAYQEQR